MKLSEDEKKVLYILKRFQDKIINNLVLIKLLYCCELTSISKNKKRFTNYNFKHYKYGPFVNFYPFLDKVCILQKDENGKTLYNDLHNVKEEYQNISINDFSEDDQKILNEVIEKWHSACSTKFFAGNTKDGLMNYVYMTPPLLDTDYNNTIDLESYIGQEIDKLYLKKKQIESIDKKAEKYADLFDEISKVL